MRSSVVAETIHRYKGRRVRITTTSGKEYVMIPEKVRNGNLEGVEDSGESGCIETAKIDSIFPIAEDSPSVKVSP